MLLHRQNLPARLDARKHRRRYFRLGPAQQQVAQIADGLLDDEVYRERDGGDLCGKFNQPLSSGRVAADCLKVGPRRFLMVSPRRTSRKHRRNASNGPRGSCPQTFDSRTGSDARLQVKGGAKRRPRADRSSDARLGFLFLTIVHCTV